MQKTGVIWEKSPRTRAQVVRRVCEALHNSYGRPRLGNPEDPLDDLIYIIISNKTAPIMAQNTYERVKNDFSTWDDLLGSPASRLKAVLHPAGLATVKSQQIQTALRKIQKDFGSCDLSRLAGRSEDQILEYLVSLAGVSEKVAKCVMMYTMDLAVLPVDGHVHRIAKRLGWTSRKRADQCHSELEALIPPKRRFIFHVDSILHGRSFCRPRNPACDQCCISRHCAYSQRRGVK